MRPDPDSVKKDDSDGPVFFDDETKTFPLDPAQTQIFVELCNLEAQASDPPISQLAGRIVHELDDEKQSEPIPNGLAAKLALALKGHIKQLPAGEQGTALQIVDALFQAAGGDGTVGDKGTKIIIVQT